MLGSIIGAGSSLLGGLFGMSEAKKNRKLQKQFAQNSIQWRVEDAKKAGIHPLAALGASSSAYSPVNSGFGDAIAQAGAAVGNEVASQAREKKNAPLEALNAQLVKSSIETNQAQAELYRAQALSTAANARNAALGARGGLVPTSTTRPQIGGKPLPHDATSSDAEAYEQRYGDIAQEVGGAITAYRDFVAPHMRVKVNRMSKKDREDLSWLQWLIPQITYTERKK